MIRIIGSYKIIPYIILSVLLSAISTVALAADLHVPSGDYPNIQSAIDAAQDGDVVLVADGVYTNAEDTVLNFNGKAIEVRSANGPEDCTIRTFNPAITFENGEGPESVFSGFTIMWSNSSRIIYVKESSPTINNCVITGCSSVGIYCESASPSINDCRFFDGHTTGIHCTNSSPVIQGCALSGNRGYGIECDNNSNPTITDSSITSNSGYGIYLDSSSATITNCSISDNYNSGIYCKNTSCPVITDCAISGNWNNGLFCNNNSNASVSCCHISGNHSGVYCSDSSPTVSKSTIAHHNGNAIECLTGSLPIFTNCMITDNLQDNDPIIYTQKSSPTFINCTIYNHPSSTPQRYAFECVESSPIITNSIVWVDFFPAFNLDSLSSPVVTYSLIQMENQGIFPGQGNINKEPGFIDPGTLTIPGDYHLANHSMCIDAGTDIGTPSADIDGDTRPFGLRVDIGADELTTSCPIVRAGDDQSVIEGHDVTLDATASYDYTGTIETYFWEQTAGISIDLSDPNSPTPQFSAPSITGPGSESLDFCLTVTNADGNQSTDTCQVQVTDLMTADFTCSSTSGFMPITIDFIDNSSGDITSWSWDFGDGSPPSTEQSPSHIYDTAGLFTPSLTVSSPEGSDTQVRPDYISIENPIPAALFSASSTSGAAPMYVAFTDESTGDITDWLWDFGDGATSTDQKPSHTYINPGTYPVSLTVTGPSGEDTLSVSDYITATIPAPSAAFIATPRNGPTPLEVTFTDTSTGSITDWEWDFGDGSTSTEQNPKHTYTSSGEYTVSLTATGPGGTNKRTRSDYIKVALSAPVAHFSASTVSGLTPLTVKFTNQATGDIALWSWDFGDNSTSFDQNPEHEYKAEGTYSVSLKVVGKDGSGEDTELKTDFITVTDIPVAPVALFSASRKNGSSPLKTSFTSTSTGNITDWEWDFGDGSTSTDENPSHTYNTIGSYTVSLSVTSPEGSDTKTVPGFITVNAPPAKPTAGFSASATKGITPFKTVFTDESTGSVSSWLWDFGDNITSTLKNPEHTFSTPGIYTVSLTATGPGGSDTFTRDSYITSTNPTLPPVSQFSASSTQGIAPLTVSYTDQSQGSITSWSWQLGDGTIASTQNPSYTYTIEGEYTVMLMVTGPGGSDNETKKAYIKVDPPSNVPVAVFNTSVTSGEAPLEVSFTDMSTGIINEWLWDFGDGETSTTQNPTHVYKTQGTYTVSLTATGPDGSDSEIKTSHITAAIPSTNLPPFSDAGADQEVYEGETVQLDGSGSFDANEDSIIYTWSQISGPEITLSNIKSDHPTFVAPEIGSEEDAESFEEDTKEDDGTYDIVLNLNVKDIWGTESNSEITITVLSTPIIAEEYSDDDDKEWYTCFIGSACAK